MRLFIAEKGLLIPTVEVDLRARAQLEPAFLAKNPGATVPVLELDDGTCLTESLAICHYLEAVRPDPNLLGHDAKERSLVLMWIDIQTLEGYLALQETLRNGSQAVRCLVPYEQIPALAKLRPAPRRSLFNKLETRLGESSFIAGDRFTYADIVGYVYLGFAKRVQRWPAVPTAAMPHRSTRPALQDWHERIATRPAPRRCA